MTDSQKYNAHARLHTFRSADRSLPALWDGGHAIVRSQADGYLFR